MLALLGSVARGLGVLLSGLTGSLAALLGDLAGLLQVALRHPGRLSQDFW